jgi:putative FmdB family regulatory protein
LPTYEYRCTKCGHRYERREGFDAPARQRCSVCGAEARRVLHAPPILFKASGFYVTDNRKGSLVGTGGASSPVESVSGGNGDKESKPETKPEKPAVAESEPSEAPAAS